MSLINDALKRAHESQAKTPGSPPPLVPVAPPSRGGSAWYLAPAIALLLVAGVVFIWLAFARQSSKPARPVAAPVAVSAPVPSPPAPAAPAAAQPKAAPAPAAPDTNAREESLPESWPKVQGIIYTQNNPMAIVNGKMVTIGDQLDHYRIKQITRYDVTFQGDDGSTKQLGIGQ